ncbi:MAG: hypothetical protein H7A01_07655 [Hahellaceae bacterium]|nr:hypothetical protein [Hahellaceae bacterium]
MDRGLQQKKLAELISLSKITPLNANSLYDDYIDLWKALGFDRMQVSLWLAALPTCKTQQEPVAQYRVTPDLSNYLLELLSQAGGRMPLAQVLKKLPAGITTSEQQIRKLAQQHGQLDIKGPFLVLVH